MSFILDALQRAESLRGHQTPTTPLESSLNDIAEPVKTRRPIGIPLLLTSLAIVALLAAGIFFRADRDAAEITRTARQDAPAIPSFAALSPDTPLADVAQTQNRQVRSLNKEAARANPAQQSPAGSVTVSSNLPATVETNAAVKPGTVTVSNAPLSASATPARVFTNITEELLPSYQELVLSRRVQMPEFHLDIHVYAPIPERRFVFVNNRKYREGDKLDEGGTVERITPVGAVLNHRGYRFELVPD